VSKVLIDSNATTKPMLLPALRILLSRNDNNFALKMMGEIYSKSGSPFKTFGIERDENIAFKYFLQAAEQGDAEAQFTVSNYYLNAYDVLLQSFKEEGETIEYDSDDSLSFDKQNFVLDKETGAYKYIDPKSRRRQKVVEEREKRKVSTNAMDFVGLSKKVSKVNLKENTTLGMEWLLKSARQGHVKAQAMVIVSSNITNHYIVG
jgi:hypothetical protein